MHQASQLALVVKNLPDDARDASDMGLICRSGSSPGGGNGNPLQDSCLENPMDRGATMGFSPGGLQSMGLPRVRRN